MAASPSSSGEDELNAIASDFKRCGVAAHAATSPAESIGLKLKCATEIADREQSWLVPDFLPDDSLIVVAGQVGKGKTTACMDWAASITNGRMPIISGRRKARNVLMLSNEDSEAQLRRLFVRLDGNLSRLYVEDEDSDLPWGLGDLPALEARILELRPALVIIDSLTTHKPSRVDLNSHGDVAPMLVGLRKLAATHGCAVVVTYAHQLASVVVWIGYLQWLKNNDIGWPKEPILRVLDNIQQRDAILARDSDGKPTEPEWPQADFIIGNPPFLGDKKMRSELGDEYVDRLRSLYDGRVSGGADLVTYWFERARAQIAAGKAKRAGLLATNSIRMVGNRPVLERIKETGGIFMAWSDRPWILEGAAVRVSMVGFDDGSQTEHTLDGQQAEVIHADLTASVNVAGALKLGENANLCFLGVMKGGPFDLTPEQAAEMLRAPLNPNGRPNSDVVKRRLIGRDIVRRNQQGWIIDFGEMTEQDSALYEMPFEYVRREVKPLRDINRDNLMQKNWWLHGRSRPALRKALTGLTRCVVTSEIAKHRVFAWMDTDIVPDHRLHVFPRDDDYFFGVLQSRAHEAWSLRVGSTLEDRPCYNSDTTFATFPFPWKPGYESAGNPLVQAIAAAARELVKRRDAWLNPPDAKPEELNKRTLTNLYNVRPAWLVDLCRKLDEAVFAAYGLPYPPSNDEIIHYLLELNRERAAGNAPTLSSDLPPKKSPGVERLPQQRPSVTVATRRYP